MKQIVNDALQIIAIMKHERLPIREFLAKYAAYFTNMDQHSLIPPECRKYDRYSESAYIFLIGSYLYQRIEGKPITWLERRRFVKYPHFSELFSRTLCSDPDRRFQSLDELKNYLEEVQQHENTIKKWDDDPAS